MKLLRLLHNIDCQLFGCQNVNITGLSHNSKTVKPGDLYFALRNNNYVNEAVANGAAAVITAEQCYGVTCIVTENVRLAMALIAKRFYKNIADKVKVVGLVGTNGKTTVTYIIKHLLETAAKKPVGLIGTITHALTTPDPIQLHKEFYQMYKKKIRIVVMEVSAHAIYYKKIAGINFFAAVWTNLTQDHLDFFDSFLEYKNTKLSFFRNSKIKFAVINADDIYAYEILTSPKTQINKYSLENKGNINAESITLTSTGKDFTVDNLGPVHIPLCGKFNIYNTLAAITTVLKFGISVSKIKSALDSLPQIPGRFNVYNVHGVTVIIDYAHTPDGLKKILLAARELTGKKKLISVFGCGGERDRNKRPQMGRISAEIADFTVLTSDNPRTENPDAIIAEIEHGINTADITAVTESMLDKTDKYIKITDRKEAIEHALSIAESGDIVVIAGKGHEDYIDINRRKIPYSDAQVVDTIAKGRGEDKK